MLQGIPENLMEWESGGQDFGKLGGQIAIAQYKERPKKQSLEVFITVNSDYWGFFSTVSLLLLEQMSEFIQ